MFAHDIIQIQIHPKKLFVCAFVPKMNTIPLQENSNDGNQLTPVPINPTAITIATQTDNPTNLGKGTKPLDPNLVKNPFENS